MLRWLTLANTRPLIRPPKPATRVHRMEYDLNLRTARLSIGEFAAFSLDPHDGEAGGGGGQSGLWRAQLGTRWHQDWHATVGRRHPTARFEVPLQGHLYHGGWTLQLTGRLDQLLPAGPGLPTTVRELKTTLEALPIAEETLRATHPAYFIQLATYLTLLRLAPPEDSPNPAPSHPATDANAVRTPSATAGTGELNFAATVAISAPATPAAPADYAAASAANGVPIAPTVAVVPVSPVTPAALRFTPLRAELVLIEATSGLSQTLLLSPSDEALVTAQLARVVTFLDLRHRAYQRLRHLQFRPAFPTPRPGQETIQAELAQALAAGPRVLFTAPTGFGKTGALLEAALHQLRQGRFQRVLYLTSKATGQLQVLRTLQAMGVQPGIVPAPAPADAPADSPATDDDLGLDTTTPVQALATTGSTTATPPAPASKPTASSLPASGFTANSVTTWQVRPKQEHCLNHVFHCVSESCAYLDRLAERWPASGLARFYLYDYLPHDLAALRAAGTQAHICPYAITRAALAFQDVWLGDYNYVFAPANRHLFYDQPGFASAHTLLIIDEAHNLPARVADAYSHACTAAEAAETLALLHDYAAAPPLRRVWSHWTDFLTHLPASEGLSLAAEDTLAELSLAVSEQLNVHAPAAAELGPLATRVLWQVPTLYAWLQDDRLRKLLWSPRPGELRATCLDAATALGETLCEYGQVILATATPGPADLFATACGLTGAIVSAPAPISKLAAPPTPVPPTPAPLALRPLAATAQIATSSASASTSNLATAPAPALVQLVAATPWREHAYRIAYDLRVDTSFQQRSRHTATTAATIARLHQAAQDAATASKPGWRNPCSWPTSFSSSSAAVLPKASTTSADDSLMPWWWGQPYPRSTPCKKPG